MRPAVDSFFALGRREPAHGKTWRQPREPQAAKMLENGYPKTSRLLKRSDYRSLFKTGVKCSRKHFLCFYARRHGEQTRLGITVTKKVGKAVTRNRIKRLCRDFFRCNHRRLGGPWDVSIVARPSVAGANRRQALRSLEDIFKIIAGNQSSEDHS